MSQQPLDPSSQPAGDSPSTPPFIRTVIARLRAQTSPPRVPGAAFTLGFTPRAVTLDMIRDCFKGLEDRFPPLLTLAQASELTGLKEQTLRVHLSEGKYPKSGRRGPSTRFMRDVFVHEFMNGGLK
jgi:hypothetical protein